MDTSINTFTLRKQLRLSKVELLVLFLVICMMPCKYLSTNALPVLQNMYQDHEDCTNRPLGQTFKRSNCEYCICHLAGEEPRCYFEECWDPKCVDPVRVPGECCEICPNGHNCEHNGIVIKEKTQKIVGDFVCSCLGSQVDTFGESKPQAVCGPF